MHVVQTDGDPPSSGRTIFPNIGWTQKSSNALTKSAVAKRKSMMLVLSALWGWGFRLVPGASTGKHQGPRTKD